MNLTLVNPILALHAFHLRNSGEHVLPNASYLWEKCVELGNNPEIPRLQKLRENLINYKINDEGISFSIRKEEEELASLSRSNNIPIEDYAKELNLLKPGLEKVKFKYPQTENYQCGGLIDAYRLHDTYLLNFTVQFIAQNLIVPPDCINVLKYLPDQISPSLGRSYFLSAEVDGEPQEIRETSDRCVEILLGRKVESTGQGQLFGSSLFEYEVLPEENGNTATYILVWLSPNSEQRRISLELFGDKKDKPYADFYQLLCCRLKIRYLLNAAGQYSDKLANTRNELDKLDDELDELKDYPESHLSEIKIQCQQRTSDYTQLLEKLATCQQSIRSNLSNYQLFLARFDKKTITGDTLKFWKDLSDETRTRLLFFDNHYELHKSHEKRLERLAKRIRYISSKHVINYPSQQLEAIWETTKDWFASDDQTRWIYNHDIPFFSLGKVPGQATQYHQDIERAFNLKLPSNWFQSYESIDAIHQSLKHLCGKDFCGNSANGERNLSINAAYWIALIAYYHRYKDDPRDNAALIKNIDWSTLRNNSTLLCQQSLERAKKTAKAIYDLCYTLFDKKDSSDSIKNTYFEERGRVLIIELAWDASDKFSKLDEEKLPSDTLNVKNSVRHLGLAMLSSKCGFMNSGSIYLKGRFLTFAAAK